MSLNKFNPEMLVLARDLRGVTQKEVALSAGLSQGLVSQIEARTRDATDDSERRIAEALRLPVEFFRQEENYSGFGISMVYYRKNSSALVKHLKRLQAEVNLRRIHLKRLLRGVNLQTPKQFQFMDIGEHGTPEDVAIRLRATWMIPLGPISNLVSMIENAGGVIFKFPFGTTDIDAMSLWPQDCPPLFFLNSQAPADRIRFSLAHELGHVIMHEVANDDIEGEADRFASEFLMPKREIASELPNMDLKRAAAMKPYWRVSMASLIRRAKDLGKITEPRYRELCIQISRLGYRKAEPIAIASEEPSLVPKMLDSYMIDSGMSMDQLAALLNWPVDEMVVRYFPATGLRMAQ